MNPISGYLSSAFRGVTVSILTSLLDYQEMAEKVYLWGTTIAYRHT